MRAPLSVVKEARKIDDLTVDFETFKPDPIFPQEQTNFMIMSKAWCVAHNAAEPVIIGGTDDNFAVRNSMGTGPFRLVSREPDSVTVVEKNPAWWDKPDAQSRPGRISCHRQRGHAGRGAAVGRDGHDLRCAAAGHARASARRPASS